VAPASPVDMRSATLGVWDFRFLGRKNSHYAVTDESGSFSLPALPPGKYTITAWHETYGEMSKEVVITADEASNLSFVFKAKPY